MGAAGGGAPKSMGGAAGGAGGAPKSIGGAAGGAAIGGGGAPIGGGGAPTGAAGGGGAPPITIVPLKAGFFGGSPAGAAGDGGAGLGGAAPGAPPGVFIMSIVPLNLGAAAPFRLKPHFVQAVAVSGFWVPQFGQNTPHLRRVLARNVFLLGRRAGSLHAPVVDSQAQDDGGGQKIVADRSSCMDRTGPRFRFVRRLGGRYESRALAALDRADR